jgi:hypothetical protein
MARRVSAQQLQLDTVVPDPRPAQKESASQQRDERKASTGNGTGAERGPRRPSPAALLETPGALLTRSDLRGLGLERRAIDAVFRSLPVVALPGYSRPLIRVEQYIELVEDHTYRDDRVRSCNA